jgi:hypothetical protein
MKVVEEPLKKNYKRFIFKKGRRARQEEVAKESKGEGELERGEYLE